MNDNHPRLISIADVCELTSLSRTSITNLRLSGDFPAEVHLGERRIAFVRAEIDRWIQDRIDARLNGGRRFRIPRAAA